MHAIIVFNKEHGTVLFHDFTEDKYFFRGYTMDESKAAIKLDIPDEHQRYNVGKRPLFLRRADRGIAYLLKKYPQVI